jgi:hypothetical protein
MHFQVPCLGIMEDFTDVVHRVLDNTNPPWGSSSSTSIGSGPEGPWLMGLENASGGQGMVASRSSRPELASGAGTQWRYRAWLGAQGLGMPPGARTWL